MKRDAKHALLTSSVAELKEKLRELVVGFLRARQEQRFQDKTKVDVKLGYKLRKQMKLIKAELRRRQFSGEMQ